MMAKEQKLTRKDYHTVKTICICVPPGLKQKLRELAADDRRTTSQYTALLIEDALKDKGLL